LRLDPAGSLSAGVESRRNYKASSGQGKKDILHPCRVYGEEDLSAVQSYPQWLDVELWNEYVEQRKKDKKAMSPRSERDRMARLYALKASGHDPNLSLAEALNGHWLDFYAPQDKSIATGRLPDYKPEEHKASAPPAGWAGDLKAKIRRVA
jgi:hypothetical protein